MYNDIISNNIDHIINLLYKRGIVAAKRYEYLGEGKYGNAYRCKNLTIKISSNEQEAAVAYSLINKKNKNIYNIHNVFKIGLFVSAAQRLFFYIIIYDYLKPLPKRYRSFVSDSEYLNEEDFLFIHDYWHDNYIYRNLLEWQRQGFHRLGEVDESSEATNKRLCDILFKFFGDYEDLSDMYPSIDILNQIFGAIQFYIETFRYEPDLHLGNVLYNPATQQIVIIDIGHQGDMKLYDYIEEL